MTQRLFYLDNLKGLLIILVVMGHIIQYSVGDYQHNGMFRFIYSFHMPLFFAISGFLTYKENYDDRLLRRRAMRLLVPFVVWAIINSLWNGIYIHKALLYPDNGLWFLYNLFVYSVVFNLSVKKQGGRWRQELSEIGIFAVSIVLMVLFGTLFNCTSLCWYMPFFAIGYNLRKYSAFVVRHGHAITFLGGVMYMICIPFWMMREEPLFYQYINLGSVVSYLYRWMVMMVGSVFFFLLGRYVFNRPFALITHLGRKTLGIYAVQFAVIHYISPFITIVNLTAYIVITTMICTSLSYIFVAGVSKVKYVRTILIGERL